MIMKKIEGIMKLQKKLLLIYLVTGIFVLLVSGVWMYAEFSKKQTGIIQTNVNNQLELIDFSLTNFFDEVEHDVQTLAENDLVRSKEDTDFTNFLTADETSFKYTIGDLEESIITILNTYRTTHPYVNSVYMGRENGSFVRSHPRNIPSQYDPRDRSWYILAKENPGTVMMTDPYPSVTTTDVNIGVVTTLLDQDGKVFGVVGADVTLIGLTNFISGLDVGYSGEFLIIDKNGTILADKDDKDLFLNIHSLLGDSADEVMNMDQGAVIIQGNNYFFHTSNKLGWKIIAIIPVSIINQEVWNFAFYPPLIGLFLTILLLGLLSNIGLHMFVISPLNDLSTFTHRISRSGNLDQHIKIRSNDEIGELGDAFNHMVDGRKQIEAALKQERDLAEALGKATGALITTLNFEQVLDLILEQVSRVVPNDAANVMLIEGINARISRSRGYKKYALEETVSQTVFIISDVPNLKNMYDKKKPILISDTAEYPEWKILEGQEFLRSYAAAPIIVHDEVIGFLNVDSSTANFFTETHLNTLEIFAGYAAIAIDNSQLHGQVQSHATDLEKHIAIATKEIRRRADELGALYKIGNEITSTLNLEVMLQIITDNAKKIMSASKSIIMLIDKKGKRLVHVFGSGFSKVELESQTIEEFLDGISGWVLEKKIPTLSENIQKDERNRGKAMARAIIGRKKSIAVAPLIITGDVIGTLTVINNERKRVFNSDDLNLVTMLASQASIAIHNANLYELAQDADRMKSAFLASMSHELRTPLNSIIGFTGILLQGLVGPLNDEQIKQLGMVKSSAAHLLELINDILDISKIEADQLKISIAPFNMNELIVKVTQGVAPLAEKKALPLHVYISPEVGQITSDQRRVEQILINLLNNAIKFTEKGEIRVECILNDGWVETHVIDSGIGIRQEDMQKLFQPFQQLDIGLSRRYEGTGLGLSICKRLLEKLGGTIWVMSEWGVGSTFSFTLPFEDQEKINGNQNTPN